MPTAPFPPDALSSEDRARYARHLVLPEVGEDGQRKLRRARVAIVGAGGLGSPASLYLAGAGVGTIGIVEFDAVDRSNLQRQILYDDSDVGRAKIDAAAARLRAFNPTIEVLLHPEALTSANALDVLAGYDAVLDGSDNFATRYLVNDACALLDKPNVHGSVFRFEGQVSVFHAGRGPCYRCLFPTPPSPDQVPNCADGGVFGVLPGTIGAMQATETIKLLLGLGDPLIGRLLHYDALAARWHSFTIPRDPDCALCGESPSIRRLSDVAAGCGTPAPARGPIGLSPSELRSRLSASERPLVIDVRSEPEFAIRALPHSTSVPLETLTTWMESADPAEAAVVVCQIGVRSKSAADHLVREGFTGVMHLTGGIDAWDADEGR